MTIQTAPRVASRTRISARTLHQRASPQTHFLGAHRVGAGSMLALVLGVALSIMTTRDPVWWHQHYSQLGTFDDFSGHVFNGTLMIAGSLLAAYGLVLRPDLHDGVGRRTTGFVRSSIAAVGAHLVILGMVPLTVSSDFHGIAAAGLAVSLVSLMLSGIGIRRLHRTARASMIVAAAVLVAGAASMLLTLITPWMFETIAFLAMGSWVVVFPRVAGAAPRAATAAAPRTMDAWQNPRPIP